jgi:hypothetical protein
MAASSVVQAQQTNGTDWSDDSTTRSSLYFSGSVTPARAEPWRSGDNSSRWSRRATSANNVNEVDVWDDGQAFRAGMPMRHKAARYWVYSHYPALSYTLPDPPPHKTYVAPSPPITPYHDPYFEERFWDDLEKDRDLSELWGW